MAEDFLGLSQSDLDKLLKQHNEEKPKSENDERRKKMSQRLSESAKRSETIDESEATVRQEEVDALLDKDDRPRKKPSQTVLSRLL